MLEFGEILPERARTLGRRKRLAPTARKAVMLAHGPYSARLTLSRADWVLADLLHGARDDVEVERRAAVVVVAPGQAPDVEGLHAADRVDDHLVARRLGAQLDQLGGWIGVVEDLVQGRA